MSTQAPLEGPLRVELVFVMPRPGYLRWKRRPMPRQHHTSTPDAENLAKSFLDALTGLVWRDDSQVAELHLVKLIASGDEQPHVEVHIVPLGEPVETAELPLFAETGD